MNDYLDPDIRFDDDAQRFPSPVFSGPSELETLRARVAELEAALEQMKRYYGELKAFSEKLENQKVEEMSFIASTQNELEARCIADEALAESRLTVLNEKAEEARREWQRAENAEAERDALRDKAAPKLAQSLIEWAANPGLHSKVYPTRCFFCGTQFPNEYEAHAADCLHIQAFNALKGGGK